MSDNIKVVVKVRPLIQREIENKLLHQWRVNNNALIQIDLNGKECGGKYIFDKIYDERTKTSDVYNDIAKPIVEAAVAGFNGTIFAYGQTSSGKTYTMTGTDDSPGIITLAVVNLFDIIKNVPDRDFLVRVSFIEIYNETLIDLLSSKKTVKIHDTFQGVKLDATEKVATSPEEVLKVMREGKANRQTGATNMNDESSRSHSIFQITIESREHIEGEEEVGSVNVSQLNLVDLAGSERSGQTGATGLRFKEGTHINKSLSVLALVIKQLSEDRNKHTNYRDSKLTRILQNSLGGNAKTSIICAVTPAAVEETISTLQFANRAKAIKNTPAVNAVATDATMIQTLTKQLASLKTQLEGKRNVEQDNANLQKQIGNLQRLILNGFGQSSNPEIMSGARRKLHQPRRVTISTLRSIQEDALPTAPKFCTPSLKYNPMSLVSLSDLIPIRSASSLSSVAEEPRLITPPPTDRKITINEEIIEIDSDDDKSVDIQTCSPYHGCFESSKTPPCVLRKHAQLAEKNLRDIVELTEREKIYAPNVVEQMEKSEKQSIKIAQLEESIIKLEEVTKEKDAEMEKLKCKISDAEQQIKDISLVKDKLESECKNFTTKITDWEVSYETLQKKTKRREEELLSLLEEQEGKKKNEKIGKISSKATQMELARDVEMANDTSVVKNENDESFINSKKVLWHDKFCSKKGIEGQLSLEEKILHLQTNLETEKVKLVSIENINSEYQHIISNLKEKILNLENESAFQKLTIDELNCTIESQNSAAELLKTDIESCNNVITELKINLNQKDIFLNNVNDSDLETMITNEELLIANNESLKHIIQSFKVALDVRNTEIKNLKLSLDKTSIEKCKSLEEELKNKNDNISLLNKEIETLNKQIELNVTVAQNYLLEQNKFMTLEQQLITQLSELQEEKAVLEKTLEENLSMAKCAFQKLQSIVLSLSGDVLEVPLMIDNLVFGSLCNNLTFLESIANITEKERNNLRAITERHEKFIRTIKSHIEDLDNIVAAYYKGNDNNSKSLMENEVSTSDPSNITEDIYKNLECKISRTIDKISSTNQYLHQCLQDKDKELSDIKLQFDCNPELETTDHLQVIENITNKYKLLLLNIFQEVKAAATKIGIENNVSFEHENNPGIIHEHVVLFLSEIFNHIMILQSNHETECNVFKKLLSEAKIENHNLSEEIIYLKNNNVDLSVQLKKIHDDSENITENLKQNYTIINQLRQDITTKTNEIQMIENKAKEWKDKFQALDVLMKDQINMLVIENAELKAKCINLDIQCRQNSRSIDSITYLASGDQNLIAKPLTDVIELNSPPSLFTICYSRLIELIQPNADSCLDSSSSSSTSDLKYTCNICHCTAPTAELKTLHEDNNNLMKRIDQLEMINNCLMKEKAEVQQEVQLLIVNTHDLQKKIVNHRTNLSTLTATTYAENKSLSSQIKFLQHHHNRLLNVCQKDIPVLKKQLQELKVLLKYENIQNQNENINQSSLPETLDNITSLQSKFKNESTFDSDLLMLDTNVTITTCDSTLVGQNDQTYLDVTQVCLYNEVASQTSLNEINSCHLFHSQMDMQPLDRIKTLETLDSLKIENQKLRILVDDYNKNKNSDTTTPDEFNSSTNCIFDKSGYLINNNESLNMCHNCNYNILAIEEKHKIEIDVISKKLKEIESQKYDIEQKYLSLSLEIPSSDNLLQKLSTLKKMHSAKEIEITKITETLNDKNRQFEHLQKENDILSNQVIETITEFDDLKKKYDSLQEMNSDLSENYSLLNSEMEELKHKSDKEMVCRECKLRNKIFETLENNLESPSHIKLNSDNSSRCNKICTLQNELHAGKEDCIELKEDVTTIKNHLERNDLSISQTMNLDAQIYSLEDFANINFQESKIDRNIPVETDHISISDKETCLNYYAEKTGIDKKKLLHDVNIVDIMKMLCDDIEIKHANEVENLVNKLKDFEDNKRKLQIYIDSLKIENTKITKELLEKNSYFDTMAKVVLHLRNNITSMRESINHQDILIDFRHKFLKVVDKEFGCSSADIYEVALQRLRQEYTNQTDRLQCEKIKLENDVQALDKKLHVANDNLLNLKSQFTHKEDEFSLLEKQKQKIQEVNTVVTLNLVKMEDSLRKQITGHFSKLVEANIITEEIDLSLPTNKLLELIFELVLSNSGLIIKERLENENDSIKAEVIKLKSLLNAKNEELHTLSNKLQGIQELNTSILSDIATKCEELQNKNSQYNNLNETYLISLKENENNIQVINQLKDEINQIKEMLISKNNLIKSLEEKIQTYNEQNELENQSKISHLINSLVNLQKEMEHLKSLNENILKEKERCSIDLDIAHEIIKSNKVDLANMTAEVLILRETVKESSNVIDNLKKEFKTLNQSQDTLVEKNKQLQEDCCRLETNIKTHEKTAQIQSRMIVRLKQQKEKGDNLICEKDLKLEEITEKCKSLQTEYKKLTRDLKVSIDELVELRNVKLLLEARLSDLEEELQNYKRRHSLDAITETSRRHRRQSLHDSKRIFTDDIKEHRHTDDVLMDVDGVSLSRSTPVDTGREQDSLLAKYDQQTDRDEEHSRSNSVQATRRRRQSVHDMRRSVRETPEPHENSRESSHNKSVDSEVMQLRKQLSSCRQELEELKEKYREVDEECEICAEYLRERDEQCANLKTEVKQLESTIVDLQKKIKNAIPNHDLGNTKSSYAHASVNTDEDWANLHSVVVDRMSFDAEVEKNKKLVRIVEELRFKKQDLKMTMAKMQKALEKHSLRDKELEETRAELVSCQNELVELRERYKELDDECETCAAYLRERDEQCIKLKEAKMALEAKLLEYAQEGTAAHSLRKKRHALHDEQRTPTVSLADVATDTSDDLLMYGVERDNSKATTDEIQNVELKRLKVALEKVTQQNAELEHQLSSTPLYVATGSAIVKNQQITDVIKENQKLKKMNAKLLGYCKKRGKSLGSNRENEDPTGSNQ